MNAETRGVSLFLDGAPDDGAWVLGRVVLTDAQRFRIASDGRALDVVRREPAAESLPPLGAWVRARGELHGQVLHAREIEVVARAQREPLRADSDAYFGATSGAAMLHARARGLRAIREHFARGGFTEVETPALVRSPGLELHLTALEVNGAGERRYLPTSPEYHMKRLLAAGLTRIYQLGKAFRAEERGALHEPEFTMLEWYRAGAGTEELMQDTEALVAQVALALTGSTRAPGVQAPVDLAPPWERLSVAQAFEKHAGMQLSELRDEDQFFQVLVERVEPKLGRGKPTFLERYPASMAALARLCPDDPSVAERFEAYVDGIELCNGFGELTDPVEQRARLLADQAARKKLGRPVYPIDERFLQALSDGIPPSGGNALGVDRLLMLVLGKRDITDVLAFGGERA